jgi:hypothetical protein
VKRKHHRKMSDESSVRLLRQNRVRCRESKNGAADPRLLRNNKRNGDVENVTFVPNLLRGFRGTPSGNLSRNMNRLIGPACNATRFKRSVGELKTLSALCEGRRSNGTNARLRCGGGSDDPSLRRVVSDKDERNNETQFQNTQNGRWFLATVLGFP